MHIGLKTWILFKKPMDILAELIHTSCYWYDTLLARLKWVVHTYFYPSKWHRVTKVVIMNKKVSLLQLDSGFIIFANFSVIYIKRSKGSEIALWYFSLKNLGIRRLFWTKNYFFFHAWAKRHVKFKVRQKSWIMSLCIIYHEECNNYKLMTRLQLGCNHSESCWSDLWPISCTILYLG